MTDMKNTSFYISLITLVSILQAFSSINAQQGPNYKQRIEQIETQKIAFITRQVDLTLAEAEKFWPVYNDINNRKAEIEQQIRQPFKYGKPEISELSDEEVDKIMTERVAYEQQLLDLRLESLGKFKKVLPVKKVYKYFEAEAQFKKILLERLRDFKQDSGNQRKK